MNTGCQIIVLDRNVDIKKSDRGFRDFPFQFKDRMERVNKIDKSIKKKKNRSQNLNSALSARVIKFLLLLLLLLLFLFLISVYCMSEMQSYISN